MSQHDRLERLIHQSLDREISPAEEQELQQLLQNDPQAQALFDQHRALHQSCTRIVQDDLIETGLAPEAIVLAAQEEVHHTLPAPNPFKRLLDSRFASGLAAGLLFATLLMTWFDGGSPPAPQPIAHSVASPNNINPSPYGLSVPATTVGTNPQHRPNLYDITDANGHRWLIEGIHREAQNPEP